MRLTIETKPFDVADFLNSEERISVYLNEAFETGDPRAIASVICDVARSRNLWLLAKSAG